MAYHYDRGNLQKIIEYSKNSSGQPQYLNPYENNKIMNSQNQLMTEIRNSLILECSEDYVGLWSIIWEFREIGQEQNTLERKKKTMSLIQELLEEDLIKAASFSDEKKEFIKWDISVSEILAQIEREWSDLGREPDLWEIVWFTATEKGEKEANRLLMGILNRSC